MSEFEWEDPGLPDTLPVEERPDWLPAKFKTPEAMVDSYKALERRLTEVSRTNADLNQALADLQAPFEAQYSGQREYEPQVEYEQYPGSQYDQLAAMRQLAEQANYEPARQLSPALHAALTEIVASKNTQNLSAQAEQMVAEHIHDWPEVKPQVTSLLNSNTEWGNALKQAAQTGNAAHVAGILSSAISPVQANRENSRSMKLAAQGLVGGGGKPGRQSPEEEGWSRIVNAGNRTYSELMAGR
jgi:hypothetical protein